jgi:1-acyl-sn-glycerol-3-phosphate acyltransferase
MITAAGVRVHVENADKMKGPTLLMYSHASNLDPICLAASSPVVFKWVGKKELFLVPIFGWMMLGCGTQPISRGNRKKAVKTLASMRMQFETYGRSLSIAPEGTRSKSGLILPFKSGPFYLWEDTNLSVSPAIMFGAYELWPPKQFFTSTGQVVVRFSDSISPPADNVAGAPDSQGRNRGGDSDADQIANQKKVRRETMKSKVFSNMIQQATGAAPLDGSPPISPDKYPSEIAGQPLSALPPLEQLAFAVEYVLLLCGLWGIWTALGSLYTTIFAGLSATAFVGYFLVFTVVVDAIIFVQY